MQRIELYEQQVSRAIDARAPEVGRTRIGAALWIEIKRHFGLQIACLPDSDFYRTFLNSMTRDVFATIGVDEEIEFTATTAGRASGSVPIRVYPVGDSLHRGGARTSGGSTLSRPLGEVDCFARESAGNRPHFDSRRQSAAPNWWK